MNKESKKKNSKAEIYSIENVTKSVGKSILKLTYLEYLREVFVKNYFKTIQTHGLAYNGTNFVFNMNSEEKSLELQKRNVFKEFFSFKPKKPNHENNEDVEGFVWVEEPEKKENDIQKQSTLRDRLRKFFLLQPELYKEKPRKEGEDYMVDDFVLLQPEKESIFHMDYKLKESCIDFISGSLAGIAQVYVSQPLDTVKVKQQTFPKLYGNMFKCLMHTYRRDGISRGLYAGTFPAVMASFAENSVLFTAYGGCQKAVAMFMEIEKLDDLSIFGNACAGFLAAFFSSFTLCPTELIKCRLQAVHEMKQFVAKKRTAIPLGTFKITRDILANEGIFGFYRGLCPTFVREMPGFFFFFGGYEAAREYFALPHQHKEDIGPLKTMCAGSVGGVALWISTFPADVIKSRIQIKNLKASMISVGLDILKKEGFLAFYNGLLPTVIRTIPATATLFLVYEYSKKILTNKW